MAVGMTTCKDVQQAHAARDKFARIIGEPCTVSSTRIVTCPDGLEITAELIDDLEQEHWLKIMHDKWLTGQRVFTREEFTS